MGTGSTHISHRYIKVVGRGVAGGVDGRRIGGREATAGALAGADRSCPPPILPAPRRLAP